MGRPKKIKELHGAHGMIEQETFKPRNLDQLLGYDNSNKYSFLKDRSSSSEYESFLTKLSDTDFYEHCQAFGLVYTDNRKLIEKKLLNDFELSRSQYNRIPDVKTTATPDYDLVKKIMSQGR